VKDSQAKCLNRSSLIADATTRHWIRYEHTRLVKRG